MLIIFILYWFVFDRKNWRLIVIPCAVFGVVFLGLMVPLDFVVSGAWQNPLTTVQNMLSFAVSLSSSEVFGISISSEPWEWLVNRGVIFYSYSLQRIAMTSYTLVILICPIVIYLVYYTLRKDLSAFFGTAWLISTYLVWIPVSLIFHRLMYIYYFYPVIPGLCLALGSGHEKLLTNVYNLGGHRFTVAEKIGTGFYLFLHFVLFILLSPVSVPLIEWIKLF